MSETIQLAVCGLHMRGFSLNHQLTDLNAKFVSVANTAPVYKLYAIPTFPEKPGLVRCEEGGSSIEVEIFSLTYEALGKFLSMIPSPLGLGKIVLSDETSVIGFICEPYALSDATDITSFRGWRYYRSSLK